MRFLLGALFLALAGSACGGGGQKAAETKTVTQVVTTTSSTTTPTVRTRGRYHYSQSLVTNFMRSCTKGDTAKQAYCACTLDKLSNNVSTRDFLRIGLSGGSVSPRVRRLIRQAAVACAGKL